MTFDSGSFRFLPKMGYSRRKEEDQQHRVVANEGLDKVYKEVTNVLRRVAICRKTGERRSGKKKEGRKRAKGTW